MPVDGDNSISQKIADQSPCKTARLAGFLYFVYIITSFIANYFGQFVSVDASTTLNNIIAHESLFRIGFVISLFSVVFFLLAAWALYLIFAQIHAISIY